MTTKVNKLRRCLDMLEDIASQAADVDDLAVEDNCRHAIEAIVDILEGLTSPVSRRQEVNR